MEEREKARFTLRISKETLGKLGYIAGYNGRTKNKELEQLIRSRIKSFENKHGPITCTENEMGVEKESRENKENED